jgi:hypothetical protein
MWSSENIDISANRVLSLAGTSHMASPGCRRAGKYSNIRDCNVRLRSAGSTPALPEAFASEMPDPEGESVAA